MDKPEPHTQDLRDVGLKVTRPRLRILQLFEEVESRHLSAEDVYRHLHESGADIGLATVYRVLAQFEAAGLLVRHNFEEGRSVFELGSDEHHDHMVDVDSGKVIEFVDHDIEALQHAVAERHGYDIVSHNMVLFVRARDGRTRR